MGHNVDWCVITKTVWRHTWGIDGHSTRLSGHGGKMRAGHVVQLGCAVCNPAQGRSHVGGPSMLVCSHCQPRHWYPGCCSRDSLAPVPPSVIPEHCAPIQVLPSNPSQSKQSESIRLPHWQSDSVWVNSSLIHIITYYYKDYIYF